MIPIKVRSEAATMSKKPLTINSVAKQSGVGVETIRYYQRIGLLEKTRQTFIRLSHLFRRYYFEIAIHPAGQRTWF